MCDMLTVHEGDYYRLLTPGEYEVTARQDGYEPQTQRVSVTSTSHQQAQRVDFRLTPLPAVSNTSSSCHSKQLQSTPNQLGATQPGCS